MNKLLRLFVYGTLKSGYENHDLFCRGAVSINPAMVRGKLFEHPAGFPMLVVPEDDILAVGTSNPLEDLATQEEFHANLLGSKPIVPYKNDQTLDWKIIHGELITFNDTAVRLPALDELEDFYPDQASLYIRVLVRVQTKQQNFKSAWTYISGAAVTNLVPIIDNHWSS